MTHTIREKTKLLARVRRIRGQVEAIERALEAEVGCADVLQVIASVRGAVNGLMAEVIEDHVRCHVTAPALAASERAAGADDLIEVVRAYLK
jgi:DNA-binding FrmR family transcriptional regulator